MEENARATAHGSPAPPRGYQAAPPPRRGACRPDLPTLAGAAASLRRADRGRRSRTSPPQAAEAAAAAARARLPKPAGGRSAAEVDRRHPALASPPPVSSLSPPGPRPRPLRRQGPRRLRRSRPGPPSAPRVAFVGRAPPRLAPPPAAPPPPPSGAPSRLQLAACAYGVLVPGPAWAGGVGRERARSHSLCADCGAPGGGPGDAERRQSGNRAAPLDLADCRLHRWVRDLEQVTPIAPGGQRALGGTAR